MCVYYFYYSCHVALFNTKWFTTQKYLYICFITLNYFNTKYFTIYSLKAYTVAKRFFVFPKDGISSSVVRILPIHLLLLRTLNHNKYCSKW